eukprot:TRINITY_DN1001_c0_g1_i11.p1 TRINITY_DN1001_c0_g1~~TRINITY_DN1001_c0_g1_i11.p1  ORF type:complete len:496 (+),score=151.79 TRINITY_DN1001_c0_g1_i11:586-2073(+)
MDSSGWFKCAKEMASIEEKEVKIPENFECDKCALQLSWKHGDFTNVTRANTSHPKAKINSQNNKPTQQEEKEQEAKETQTTADQDKGLNPLYIAAGVGGIGVIVLLCSLGKKQQPQESNKTPQPAHEEPVIEKSKREARKRDEKELEGQKLEDDKQVYAPEEPLAEFRRPERKFQDAVVEESAVNVEEPPAAAYKLPDDSEPLSEKPVRMGRGRPQRNPPQYEVMVQGEERIQDPPEIVQEKKPVALSRVYSELSAEETKSSGDAASEPIKEMSSAAKKPQKDAASSENRKGVKKVVDSSQGEEVKEFKETSSGKTLWKNTHFIFIFDCSKDMEGAPWDSTIAGYIDCMEKLKSMENILVSAFSFDTIRNPFCREKAPSKAPVDKAVIPYTGKGRKYDRALKYVAQLVERHPNKDYLSCIVFVSNGMGSYTEANLKDLLKQRTAGRKIVSYIISAAPTPEDEEDMLNMAKDLKGDFYSVGTPDKIRDVLLSALEL